jgi:hypothetical protein
MGVVSVPGTALGLVVSDAVQGSGLISGTGCGQVGEAAVRLPRKTRSARILDPQLGAVISYGGRRVAVLTGRSVERDSSGLLARFTATGSDDVCARPTAYPGGWTGYLDYYVAVRRSVHVYASTRCLQGVAARPRAIRVDCSRNRNLSLSGLRWRTWDGKTARGRGVARLNDCKPTCAQGRHRRYHVTVTLSRAKDCGRWLYQRITISFPAAPPDGFTRAHPYSFPFGYCPS